MKAKAMWRVSRNLWTNNGPPRAVLNADPDVRHNTWRGVWYVDCHADDAETHAKLEKALKEIEGADPVRVSGRD